MGTAELAMGTNEGSSFGARLRRLREASGLSQEELAHRAGLTPNAVGTLERGERRRPYPNTIRALADALELGGDDRAALIASVPARKRPSAKLGLPTPPTPLIGRARDVRSVDHWFRSQEARLVTLTGPGGVGKTRLAYEIALQLVEEFSDGVVLVDLAPLDSADLVLPTLGRSLGLRQTAPVREALRESLSSRRLLLLLDNFEHVLDAARDVAWLLEVCPELAILMTSRAPLRIRGEHEYHVVPLGVPDPGSMPRAEDVARAPAVQLFLERVREAAPAFSLNQKNSATVAAICWRLEGLPLAIELAAAQMRFLGPTSLLARLDTALQSTGARDLPPRQKTMRATLDWDHDLLAEEERVAFRRLGVFVGGFTLESGEAVITDDALSDESTVMHIGELVEKSLLTVDHQAASEAVRYRMLEPVRQYSLERLAQSGETHSVRSRHADHFSELAEQGASGLKGADQLMWLELLGEEYDNVRAALGYLLEQGNTDQAAQIGWNLWLFWSLRGHVAEDRRWMESLLAREQATSGRGHARALWVLAMFSYMRADFDSMLAMLEEILAADEDLDEETLNQALVLQGHGLAQRGDLDDAESVLKRGLDLAGLRGDRWYIVHALHGLVHVATARSDFDTAIPLVRDSLTIARDVGERWALALSLTIYSVIELTRGEDEHAETLLEECTSLSITLRDPFTTAYSLTGLAVIAGRRGDGVRMAHLAGAADALRESKALDIGITIWRTLFDEDVGSARERMGPDEFDLAYARGRSMTPEELVGNEVPIGT